METSIRCQWHQEFLVQYIFLKQKNIKFGCVECISELQDENQSVNIFNNILLLHDIQQRPQKLLSQISNIDDQNLQFYSRFHKKTVSIIMQAFENWENNMRNFQKQIDNIILQQKGFVEELIANYKNTMQQLSHVKLTQEIKFEEFQNLIKEFGTANEKLQNDVLEQISYKITQHFEILDRNNAKELNESLKRIKQEYIQHQENINLPDVQELQNSFQYAIKSTDDLYSQMGKSLNFVNQMNSSIIPNSYSKYLIGLIKSKLNYSMKQIMLILNELQDIKQIKNLYLGSRDGLNGQSLWNKIDGKEHLIYIFKSKNPGNYVFGSYIPCRVKQDLNNWQSDESLSSFIFSYTHNEIYPIKQSERQHAILCQPISYAVWIGMSGNIGICNDFINGQSYLGSSYEWDKFENKRSSHLFGGDTPNVEECEVYELLI